MTLVSHFFLKIWMPYVYLHNHIDSSFRVDLTARRQRHKIDGCTGVVKAYSTPRLQVLCPLNYKWYPFDTQVRLRQEVQ